MPRIRYGGIGLPDADFDVEFAVEVEGDDEEVVEKVAMAAREHGVRALQAFDTGAHPDECDGVPVSIEWEDVLEAREPTGSTDEDTDDDAAADAEDRGSE